MATRVETLIDTLVTTLEADAGITPGSVYRSRVEPYSDTELPAYSIHIGQDTPLNDLGPDNVRFMDWAQLVFIDLYAKSIATNIDAVFLTMRSYVHRALMADVTQGTNFVLQTIPTGADEPILDHSGEQKTMVYRTGWEFRLRTAIADLETT
jgi:hypothetical protein